MSRASRPLSQAPTALVRRPGGDGWWHFDTVHEVLRADSLDAVTAVLAGAEAAAERGAWAVGFCAYEAAPAFDSALVAHDRWPGEPLAWFALCDPPAMLADADLPPADAVSMGSLRATLDADDHRAGVERIRRWIARGDTYQVNYTHHLEGRLAGDPWGLFLALDRGQRSPYASWLDTGQVVVCSSSPELFFELDGDRLVTRPMKGTARRGRTRAEDRLRAAELACSPKDRAENVMIVDMIRNDLGRLADTGTVATTRLFDVERYATVFQMTSTIEARTRSDLGEIFTALFPCASITGAPKVRTSRLIRRLEGAPRGVYTGAIGWIAPRRRARFSVAIRTATVRRDDGSVRYGTGGGIVWDSDPAAEYAECQDKARIVAAPRPEFELLETMLWTPDGGFVRFDRHLARLAEGAEYFDFRPPPDDDLRGRLQRAAADWRAPHRVRLTVNRDGGVHLEAHEFDRSLGGPVRLTLASRPIDSRDPFLFHKTTHRAVYERARSDHPGAEDVLLWNEHGELTESTIANLVLEIDGGLFTPPVDCGLLAGTLRAELLDRGLLSERVLSRDDLGACQAIYLISSLRGRRPARLIPAPGGAPSESDAGDETPKRRTP